MMSDKTRHPERRAGQRTATGYGCTYGDQLGGPWCPAHDEGEDGWKLWNDGVSTGMKDGEALCPGHADATATPQPSAPVVACKAPTWCGFKADSNTDERRATWLAISPKPKIFGGLLVGSPAFCSPGCFERQVPPLAAKPAEAKRQPCCIHAEDSDFDEHDDDCHAAANAQTAEQPKPAAKGHDFSDPYCARRYKGDVVRLCVACGAFDKDGMRSPKCDPTDGWRKGYEGWVGEAAQSGKPYLGPERLPRPRLAHSMGIEDPTLPEAR